MVGDCNNTSPRHGRPRWTRIAPACERSASDLTCGDQGRHGEVMNEEKKRDKLSNNQWGFERRVDANSYCIDIRLRLLTSGRMGRKEINGNNFFLGRVAC